MKSRTELILWDAALIIAISLYFMWRVSANANLIIGIIMVMILSFSIQKHIAAYKLNGKIY
jgi:hypothetical protein